MPPPTRKPLYFIASSWKDLKGLPGPVQDTFGTLLLDVQYGDTYRCVYTVNFRHAVYVLHVFQKKSRHGVATSRRDLDLVRSRYRIAERHYATLEH